MSSSGLEGSYITDSWREHRHRHHWQYTRTPTLSKYTELIIKKAQAPKVVQDLHVRALKYPGLSVTMSCFDVSGEFQRRLQVRSITIATSTLVNMHGWLPLHAHC